MRNFLFALITLLTIGSFAQGDSVPDSLKQAKNSVFIKKDTTKAKKEKYKLNPMTASLLSTFVPGAGQIYNRKYWKAPIVWGD